MRALSKAIPCELNSSYNAVSLYSAQIPVQNVASRAEVSSVNFPRVGELGKDEGDAERGAPLARALSSPSRPSQWSYSLIAFNSSTTSNFLALFAGAPAL